MDRTQAVTLTNMCMVYNGRQVLVLEKADDDWRGITFPGGHVEKDESFADSVIREVLEETGLTIVSPQLCGIKDWIREDGSRYMVLLYRTNRFEGELRSSSEGRAFWAAPEDLPHENLSPDFMDVLKVFLYDTLSEFYYYLQDGQWHHTLQ